jgi:hypothetical protein
VDSVAALRQAVTDERRREGVMTSTLRAFAVALALTCAGCSLPAGDKESDAAAKRVYEEIRTGADLSADPQLGAELKTPEAIAQLAEIRPHLPAGAPTGVTRRSWKYNVDTAGSWAELTHAYAYPNGTVVADSVLRKKRGENTWEVVGFHVKVEPNAPGQSKPATPGEKT